MCDKCAELDDKVEHYQRIASRITDQAMLAGIKELIERAKAQKAELPNSSKGAEARLHVAQMGGLTAIGKPAEFHNSTRTFQ
jgi:hypothetical protein